MIDCLIPVIQFHEQVLKYGKGSYVYDCDGKKYLDLNSGQFCTILGHSNEDLIKCVTEASETLVHTGSSMLSENVILAAEKMRKISGKMNAKSIFLSTGAEAVEFSIRYAKHISGKSGLICFDKGYHGLTLGTQSITFGGKYAVPHIDNIYSVVIPNENNIDECIFEFEKVLKDNSNKIAAAIFEPIVSVGGMLFPPRRYFKKIFSLCRNYNVLTIFDESQTGFGRTGEWFCYQHFDAIPDIVICSKGIGMGFPVSAVMFREELCKERSLSMTHYSSHQNDPFAAKIVSFGIDYIEKNNLLKSNIEKGTYFLNKLHELGNYNPLYKNPRGCGMMLGIDLYIKEVSDYRPIYSKLYEMAATEGLLIQGTDGGRVLRFLPDYLISLKDLDFCVQVLGNIHM